MDGCSFITISRVRGIAELNPLISSRIERAGCLLINT